jgi:hypothetical protein
LEKKEHGKEFLFFAGTWKFPRIPGTGKPNKRNTLRNVQPRFALAATCD